MSRSSPLYEPELEFLGQVANATSRRTFIQWAGVTISVAALAGCTSNNNTNTGGSGSVSLGAGDVGVLNYAYALEQLEAAFYTQVIATPYSGATAAEMQILGDIKVHEVIHREFLKAALGTSAIAGLSVDFTSVNFGSRASVLGAAKVFEDTGVSAYNGAGRLLTSGDYLLVAGKIVSVEARHAAAIRDLLNPLSGSFAGDDVVDPATGLDVVNTPATVLGKTGNGVTGGAGAFVTTTINFSNLPSK